MPIRPSLLSLRPNGPKPQATRKVKCPACGHTCEVSAKAITMRCPQCTEPMRFEDVTVRDQQERNVHTMGHVLITDQSTLMGQLTCGRMTNTGRFDGSATVHGPIVLAINSLTTGSLAGHSLEIPRGATFTGRVSIRPLASKPNVETPAPAADKPLSKRMRAIAPRPAVAQPTH